MADTQSIKSHILDRTTHIVALLVVILIPLKVVAADVAAFQLFADSSHSKFEYKWYGASEATYKLRLRTIGFGVDHKSGLGVRFATGKSDSTQPEKGSIHRNDFVIGLKSYREYELYYSYKIIANIKLYGGIGWYLQDVPIYKLDGETIVEYDKDNDHGYFAGIEYKYENVGIKIFYKQTSRIGDGSGSSTTVALGSTMRQYGTSIAWYF